MSVDSEGLWAEIDELRSRNYYLEQERDLAISVIRRLLVVLDDEVEDRGSTVDGLEALALAARLTKAER